MALKGQDSTGAQVSLSTTLDASGFLVGSTCITDPVTGNKQTVSQLHNADKQSLGGAGQFGTLESGPLLLIDPITLLADRARETGTDAAAPTGIAASGGMLLATIPVNSGTGAVSSAGAATITPAAMSGTFTPAQNWSIQVGTTILYDAGGANQEVVEVTAVTSTTFTATFAKTHSAGVAMLVLNYYQAKVAPGAPGVAAVNSEGYKATYRYYSAGNTPAALPTDVLTLTGSATRTVRVKKIVLSGLATTAGQMVWSLIRRSAINTGGTSTAPVPSKHDPNDPAPTAALALYTINPTGLGATVATVRGGRLFHNLATAQNDRLVFDYSTNQDKPLILRGTTDILALNGGAVALPSGATLDIEVEFEEDNS